MVDPNYTPDPGDPWAEEHLLPAEKKLLAAAKVGGTAEIRTDLANPAEGPWTGWEEKHEIRAKVIRHLLVHPDVYPLDPKGFDILGAHLTGPLDLENLKFELLLAFDRCLFDSAPLLRHSRTRILNFYACRMPGLWADGLQVEGALFLRQCECAGEVRLTDVKVSGPFDCVSTVFMNKGEDAFSADGISVSGDLSLDRASITGGTRLIGANVIGNLDCSNSTFTHNGKAAFLADNILLKGNLNFVSATITGGVCLIGANVTGNIDCHEATFSHDGGTALHADKLFVENSLIFIGTTIIGATRLIGANINSNLECLNATFINATGDAFNAQRMCVKASWFWVLKAPIMGGLNLTQASAGDFFDDGSGWPEKGKLKIDGFRYDNLIFPTTAKQRIRWLQLMPQIGLDQKLIFWPQPYEQLIKVFKTAGHERDAREVAIAKQDAYRAYLKRQAEFNNVTTWHRRLWLLFLKYSAGYGYETWRAGVFVLIFVSFAWMVFNSAYHEGHMAPAKERIYTQSCYTKNVECDKWRTDIQLKWTDKTLNLPEGYPQFTPLTYAFDTLIPFVDLHQESYWMPTHLGYQIYLWLHIIVGWVLATIAVAGFTGLIKKD